MIVSVALPDRDPDGDRRLMLTASYAGGVLSHEAHVGAGVYVGVDLMAPDRWCSVSVRTVDAATEPLLTALIGDQAVQGLRRYAHTRPGSGDGDPTRHSLAVDPGAAAPWIRVAVVDALDRWLHLPLDQSLIDAERGVSRGWAARTLPADAAARVIVVGEGLQLARRASGDVVGYLRTLGSRRRAVPSGLLAAVRHLMQGYADLVAEVSGPDRELAAVLDTWRNVSDRISAMDSDEATVGTHALGPIGRPHLPSKRSLASMIDPRQIRARVFAQSSDPAAAEVTMADTRVDDHTAVLVRVPAFRRALDQQVVPRLLVRLVDSLSTDPRGMAVLTVSPTPAARRRGLYFEGIVPLRGSSVENLRADVFDALSDVPPAWVDTDEALQGARRATVFLGEWRRLLALAQLPTAGVAPGRCLRELATRLEPKDGGPTHPLFADGPSPDDLQRLAAVGDVELLRRARSPEHDDHHSTAAGLFTLAWGSGRLLVAEITAAHSYPAR